MVCCRLTNQDVFEGRQIVGSFAHPKQKMECQYVHVVPMKFGKVYPLRVKPWRSLSISMVKQEAQSQASIWAQNYFLHIHYCLLAGSRQTVGDLYNHEYKKHVLPHFQ